jgi:hypothetical protein
MDWLCRSPCHTGLPSSRLLAGWELPQGPKEWPTLKGFGLGLFRAQRNLVPHAWLPAVMIFR